MKAHNKFEGDESESENPIILLLGDEYFSLFLRLICRLETPRGVLIVNPAAAK